MVFVIALFLMKDLSSRLRDQLMVTERDRALVEARARGLSDQDVIAATAHPWRQILKWDLVGSALGISLFLLVYYAASSFFTIYWSTVFENPSGVNFSVAQANGLNTWFWAADAIALVVFGIFSDALRVRKPFMLVGALGSIAMLVIFLRQANDPHTGYYTLVVISIIMAAFLSMTYAPWMAGYTESVEAKNPALVGTGLALWGWILRVTVGLSFIFLPLVINSVNPVVNNLVYAETAPNGTAPFNVQQFQVEHPKSVAFAEKNASWLNVLSEPQNAAVVAAANANATGANLAALNKAVGPVVFAKVVANATELKTLVVPYQSQLTYLSHHQSALLDLQNGVARSAKQWQHWFYVCLGGMVLFLPDDLPRPRALEPGQGEKGRGAARGRRRTGAARARQCRRRRNGNHEHSRLNGGRPSRAQTIVGSIVGSVRTGVTGTTCGSRTPGTGAGTSTGRGAGWTSARARSRAVPSISPGSPARWVPATSGERATMTTPATRVPRASTSAVDQSGPLRRRSPKRVTPSTMATSGLTVDRLIREAVIGPACSAFWRRNTVPTPVTASR